LLEKLGKIIGQEGAAAAGQGSCRRAASQPSAGLAGARRQARLPQAPGARPDQRARPARAIARPGQARQVCSRGPGRRGQPGAPGLLARAWRAPGCWRAWPGRRQAMPRPAASPSLLAISASRGAASRGRATGLGRPFARVRRVSVGPYARNRQNGLDASSCAI
jgi:hypothetical protein